VLAELLRTRRRDGISASQLASALPHQADGLRHRDQIKIVIGGKRFSPPAEQNESIR